MGRESDSIRLSVASETSDNPDQISMVGPVFHGKMVRPRPKFLGHRFSIDSALYNISLWVENQPPPPPPPHTHTHSHTHTPLALPEFCIPIIQYNIIILNNSATIISYIRIVMTGHDFWLALNMCWPNSSHICRTKKNYLQC